MRKLKLCKKETEKVQENDTKDDFFLNYHKPKVRFGLLLVDMNDAIQEGDGERLYDSSADMRVSWTLKICLHDTSSPDKSVCYFEWGGSSEPNLE